MAGITLKALHNSLKLLENPAELKRRTASSKPRTLKEGLAEMSKLVGLEEDAFKDPQLIAPLIGAQRFVMIGGEPSVTEQVARVFDSARLLLSVLINPAQVGNAAPSPRGTATGTSPHQGGAMAALALGSTQLTGEPSAVWTESNTHPETSVEDLKSLLSGNAGMGCRLFRALFEHMLAFTAQSGGQQGNVSLVNELTGSKEHSRSFLATALFILGAEIDRDNLISFMVQQGLFGMPVFEHLLVNRDYCEAFHTFRRLERAFVGSPAVEEAQLRTRLDTFNVQFGGKPYGAKIFEADEPDKAKIDAFQAAADLLEALALTPWLLSLKNALSVDSSMSVRSVSAIASHFERFSRGEVTKDHANQDIAGHLLAFARQFSADLKPAQSTNSS